MSNQELDSQLSSLLQIAASIRPAGQSVRFAADAARVVPVGGAAAWPWQVPQIPSYTYDGAHQLNRG